MHSFYKTANGATIKVFDCGGQDWQFKAGVIERWFSQWSFARKASLEAAFERFLGDHYDESFNSASLTIV